MAIPETQVLKVPGSLGSDSKITSITVSDTQTVTFTGQNGNSLGTIQVAGGGGTYSAKCTPVGGTPFNVNFTLSDVSNNGLTATGTYDTTAFTFQLSGTGELLSGAFPKLVGPEADFFQGLGPFKIDKWLPTRPSPTIPEPEPITPKTDAELAIGGTGLHGGPGPVEEPAFNGRCAVAVAGFIIAALATEGLSAYFGAAVVTGECHNWSFK
jgi:hypothetical protein